MKTPRPPYDRYIFTASAAGAALAALAAASGRVALVQALSLYAERGELLLHAVRSKAVSYSMPLISLLAAGASHLGFGIDLPARAAALAACLAAYAIGARGGKARGALFALAAALSLASAGGLEAEQAVYTASVLIFLALELRRQEEGGLALAAASGAAAAATLLTRSALFAFPPLAAAFHYFSARPRAGRWLAASALLLFCAYAPLLSWARLNHAVHGRAILFEEERPVSNIITGAMGMTYTIEGDARPLAGLSRTESVYPWAARQVLSHPGRYAAAVARRVWAAFGMLPLLFALAALGFAAGRGRESRLLAFFAAFFVLMHCLLSIEARYFYPLRPVLAMLAASGLWDLLKRRGLVEGGGPGLRLEYPLFAAAALPAAFAVGVTLRYPGAAAPGLIALDRELAYRPAEPWLLRAKAELLFRAGLAEEGRALLSRACALDRDPAGCYIQDTLTSLSPAEPPGNDDPYLLYFPHLLRRLQLGDTSGAKAAYDAAYSGWLTQHNGIKGPPGSYTREELDRIVGANRSFWDSDIYAALYYFPAGERVKIISRLASLAPLTPALKTFKAASAAEARGEESLENFDDSLAYLDSLLKKPWLALPRGPGLTPEDAALARALRKTASDGGLAPFLMSFEPSASGVAELYENSSSPAALADAAGRLAGAHPKNPVYPLLGWLAAGRGAETMSIAMLRSPALLVSAARTLAAAGDPGAKLLAAEAEKSPVLSDAGRAELALLWQDLGEYTRAIRLIYGLLGRDPRAPELLNSRGVLLVFMKRPSEAEAAFRAAHTADPAHMGASMNLAARLAARGVKSEAAALYRSVLNNPALPAPERQRLEIELEKLTQPAWDR